MYKRLFAKIFLILFFPLLLYASDIYKELSEDEFKKAMDRFNRAEYQSSVFLLQKALGFFPENLNARKWLGEAFLNSGYVKNAMTEWQKYLSLKPTDPIVNFKLQYLENKYIYKKLLKEETNYIRYKEIRGIEETKEKKLYKNFNLVSDIKFYPQAGLFYIASSGDKSIAVFNKNFEKIYNYSLNVKPKNLSIINIERNTYIVVLSEDGTIYSFPIIIIPLTETRVINTFSMEKKQLQKTEKFIGIADDGQYIYVISENAKIYKFSYVENNNKLTLNFLLNFSLSDLQKVQDFKLVGNNIYILDPQGSQLVVFDTFGNKINTYRIEEIKNPICMDISPDNTKVFLLGKDELKKSYSIWILDLSTGELLKILSDIEYNRDIRKLVVDDEGFLILTDLGENSLIVYRPEPLSRANIFLSIKQILNTSYPFITLRVKIQDITGKPISGLQNNNFSIKEMDLGKYVYNLHVDQTYDLFKYTHTVFIIEKSPKTLEFLPVINSFVEKYVNKLTKKEFLEVILVGSEYKYRTFEKEGGLTVSDFIQNTFIENNGNRKFGEAIYKAIGDLITKYGNKNVIVICYGDVVADEFLPYSLQTLYTYAFENAVRINVITLLNKPSEELEILAKETDGFFAPPKFLYTPTLFLQTLQSKQPLEYYINFLTYSRPKLKKYKTQWIPIRLEVKYRDMYGVEEAGYYMPFE